MVPGRANEPRCLVQQSAPYAKSALAHYPDSHLAYAGRKASAAAAAGHMGLHTEQQKGFD